jgi:hypothetical protein
VATIRQTADGGSAPRHDGDALGVLAHVRAGFDGALLAGYLLADLFGIHRTQVRRELEDLAAVERQRLQANSQLRPALHAPALLGLRNHSLHIAAYRYDDLPARADRRGGSQINEIAFLRGARVDGVFHAEQNVRALRDFSGDGAASQRESNQVRG